MKIRVEFLSQWIHHCKDKEVLNKVVQNLNDTYGVSITCDRKSFALCDISFDGGQDMADEIINCITGFLKENYAIKDIDFAVKFTVMKGGEGAHFFGSLNRADDAKEEDKKGTLAKNNDGAFEDYDEPDEITWEDLGFESQPKNSTSKHDSNALSSILQRVDKLIGCDDFKDLIHEIASVSSFIVENKTQNCFYSQNYLFSINEGYGLTTCLDILADTIGKSGLKRLSEKDCKEFKAQFPKSESAPNPFDGILNAIVEVLNSNGQCLVCIDLSEWLDNLNNKMLRDFVKIAVKLGENCIFVYRIPFVNEETFNRVKDSLCDTSFIRGVVFPTLSIEQLRECAKERLAFYNFTMNDKAWESFDKRIFEEKRDGRFYGFNTVRKIVDELVYKAQVECAKKGESLKVIDENASALICPVVKHKEIGFEILDKMVGGKIIKARVEEILAQIDIARKTGMGAPCLHMRFVGNPGTGKTTVARIIGKVLKERGVLRIGNFFEYAGRDFCGRYVGETAPKTAGICRDAYGSILFIDEAYSLYREGLSENDFGREALDTLIAEMENNRSDLLVIMAGYPNEMEKLMEGNQGLASRMPYVIEFPNFNREELAFIFESMIKEPYKAGDGLVEKVKEYFNALPDFVLNSKQFSNARFVRNLFERTLAKGAIRMRSSGALENIITKEDFELASSDKEFKFENAKPKKIGFR